MIKEYEQNGRTIELIRWWPLPPTFFQFFLSASLDTQSSLPIAYTDIPTMLIYAGRKRKRQLRTRVSTNASLACESLLGVSSLPCKNTRHIKKKTPDVLILTTPPSLCFHWRAVFSFCVIVEPSMARPRSCHIILGSFAALRDLPVDVLVGRLDIACLAVDAAVKGEATC